MTRAYSMYLFNVIKLNEYFRSSYFPYIQKKNDIDEMDSITRVSFIFLSHASHKPVVHVFLCVHHVSFQIKYTI